MTPFFKYLNSFSDVVNNKIQILGMLFILLASVNSTKVCLKEEGGAAI